MDKHDKEELLSAIGALGNKIDRLDGDVREMKGQISVALSWMQSIDQRFTAIMSPYQPPDKKRA